MKALNASARVFMSFLKVQVRTAEVTVCAPGCGPADGHAVCSARITTRTPSGLSSRTMARAIWLVSRSRSWADGESVARDAAAILERPVMRLPSRECGTLASHEGQDVVFRTCW